MQITENADDIVCRLFDYATRHGISTNPELGKVLGEFTEDKKPLSKTTVGEWFRTGKGPRKASNRKAVEKLLDSENSPPIQTPVETTSQEATLDPTPLDEGIRRKIRRVGDNLSMSLPSLVDLVIDERPLTRELLEEEMGKSEFSLLMACCRALQSERARSTTISTDPRFRGQRREK